jgi:hypothetical protein
MVKTAFLLWHVREFPDQEDDAKLLGVYSSEQKAQQAKDNAKAQPGFRESVLFVGWVERSETHHHAHRH